VQVRYGVEHPKSTLKLLGPLYLGVF
jgi:hypothetical protein